MGVMMGFTNMQWVAIFAALVLLGIAVELVRSWHRVKRQRARFAFYSVLDGQGRVARPGVAYMFACEGVGCDVSMIVVDEVRGDGTVSGFDVNFQEYVSSMQAHELWRPLLNSWDAHPVERDAIIEYAGESVLSLD